MASNPKCRKPSRSSCLKYLQNIIFFMILLFTVISLFLHGQTCFFTTTISTLPSPPWYGGDLRNAQFSWNRLPFTDDEPPPVSLRIAAFSRKWPVGGTPGGMERHALTLYTALARRGHKVHVFTSLPDHNGPSKYPPDNPSSMSPHIHYHDISSGRWDYHLAWELFDEGNSLDPFDVVHSESVSLPHWQAKDVPNLAVSWHGIALESLQSYIYQDLALRQENTPMPDSVSDVMHAALPKILKEIRFFKSYTHHVATSDSSGEMLRDVYQIPNKHVHVILNGVDEDDFGHDQNLGEAFRDRFGVPRNASMVLGVAGRIVRDKGHPLLHEAFSNLLLKYSNVYLIVVGSGPWEKRYKELGRQVIVLGSMNPSEIKGFYNAIDIFVNPTLRPQGLDISLMEAMLSGKPLLTSRFPSIKGSVVVNDDFGFMFSPNVESLFEALKNVVEEGAERLARMGRACREYADSMFTARKMALAYEKLFLCIKNETYCEYPEL